MGERNAPFDRIGDNLRCPSNSFRGLTIPNGDHLVGEFHNPLSSGEVSHLVGIGRLQYFDIVRFCQQLAVSAQRISFEKPAHNPGTVTRHEFRRRGPR